MLVQKLRIQRGWSQQQLAELSGLSVRTVQRIERGQPASAETLKSLASVFEIDFSELVPAVAPANDPETTMDPADTPARAAAGSPPQNERQSAEERLALRHVRQLRDFYTHLATYVGVLSMLLVMNLLMQPRYLWVVWPALGWGIAIVVQALGIWGPSRFLGPDWERRQVEKRLGRPL
ncbi:XRE family transcriptional regulator [Rubrivivax gelatinosus]|nr:XRE family transcriptional regulator [Rubrivivax gelatinosus]